VYNLRDFDKRMVDVPNAIAEDFLFHLFCPIAEFLEVVYILLKILLEELLYMDQQVPLGSRNSAPLRSASGRG